ncbi:hypothetical protein AB8Q84_06975 [Klebsiella quasivariicola]|uniref:hypothetical protein n=1 Tax=Klebsiella quasivariicola TaxID=2026240 RepID=UPI0038D1DE74
MIDWLVNVDNLTMLAAWAGFVLSVLQLLKSKTSIKLFLGCHLHEDRIDVSNLSAHDVTLSSAGVVTASGRLIMLSDEHSDEHMISPMLPRRLKARDEIILEIPFINKAYHNKMHHRGGVFVTTSDGKLFSDVSWLRRRWWWLLSVILKDSKR